MAIAAGTPVPSVYVIEQPGINAFAVGYSPSEAIIGITRGASPEVKKQLMVGCIACSTHDDRITVPEAELLRAIASYIETPMPPLLPSHIARRATQ